MGLKFTLSCHILHSRWRHEPASQVRKRRQAPGVTRRNQKLELSARAKSIDGLIRTAATSEG